MDILTALAHRSPWSDSLHVSRQPASAYTRDMIEAIVQTNIQQVKLTNLKTNGFSGTRVAFGKYLIDRFPNARILIIIPQQL